MLKFEIRYKSSLPMNSDYRQKQKPNSTTEVHRAYTVMGNLEICFRVKGSFEDLGDLCPKLM